MTLPRTIPLAEMIEAYLQIEAENGEKLSNADLAAELADNIIAQGLVEVSDEDEADINLLIHDIEAELPYYTGRRK